MANLTPQQAAEILRLIPGAVQQAVETEQAIAILDMEADIKSRVFTNGKSADGQRIGAYSTKPLYVSISGARKRYLSQIPTSRLRGRGKNSNKAKFANGKPRKSQYFGDGYSGFRAFMGRDVSTVNLDLTGDLFNSIGSGTRQATSVVEFRNAASSELAGHLEVKYGKVIFAANTEEVAALTDRLVQAAEEVLQKLLP